MKLNEKLDYIKRISGFTDETLAVALDLDAKEVKGWMLGKEPNLEGYKALSKVLSLSLDYLAYDLPITDKDKSAKSVIEKAMKEDQVKERYTELVKKCKGFLKQFNVTYDEKILPKLLKGKIDYNCFKIDGENISLIREKLVEYRQNELVKKAFPMNFTVTEAIKLDDVEALENALESYHKKLDRFHSLGGGTPSPKCYAPGFRFDRHTDEREKERDEINDYLISEDFDVILENLDPSLEHYFEFVVMLIDEGAQYKKQNGHGCDITCFDVVPDISKTNFFYRVAKEMVGLKTKLASEKNAK